MLGVFGNQYDGIDIEKVTTNLDILHNTKIKDEPATTTAARTQLAILMGWGIAGGYRALHLYNALPPSRYQLDHVFIRRRIEAFLEFVQVDKADLGEEHL